MTFSRAGNDGIPRDGRVIVPGEAPFGPVPVLIATLVASIIAGGYLAALNWDRFGKPQRRRPTLIGAVAGYALLGVSAAVGYALTLNAVLILPALLLNAAGGVALVLWQRQDYAAWVAEHGAPTRDQVNFNGVLWMVAIIAFVQSCILLPFMINAVLPFTSGVLPDAVYTADGITLSYDRRWMPIDISSDPLCQQADTDCLLSLRHDTGAGIIDVIRVHTDESVEAYAAALWESISGSMADVELVQEGETTLAGLPAWVVVYRQANPYSEDANEPTLYVRRVLARFDGAIYRFTLLGDNGDYFEGPLSRDFARLLASVGFGLTP